MPPEASATFAALGRPVPASGWTSWAPEVMEISEPPSSIESLESEASFGLLGGAVSLLMWGCASLLAVWYL